MPSDATGVERVAKQLSTRVLSDPASGQVIKDGLPQVPDPLTVDEDSPPALSDVVPADGHQPASSTGSTPPLANHDVYREASISSARSRTQTIREPTISSIEYRRQHGYSRSFPDIEKLSEIETLNLVLRIDDVPYNGGEYRDCMKPLIRASDTRAAFQRLEPHGNNVIRIFNFTHELGWIEKARMSSIRTCLFDHIEAVYGSYEGLHTIAGTTTFEKHIGEVDGAGPATDISAILAQFDQHLDSHDIKIIRTPTRLRPGKVKGRFEVTSSDLCCFKGKNDQVAVLIVNRSRKHVKIPIMYGSIPYFPIPFVNKDFGPFSSPHKHWDKVLEGKPPQLRVASLLLDFFLACLYLQDADDFRSLFQFYFPHFKNDPLLPMILSLTHQYREIPATSDSEVAEYLQECEQILQEVRDVTDATSFLFSMIGLTPSTSFADQDLAYHVHARELCSQRRLNCERRMEWIHRALDTQNKLLNIHESASLKRLTILAALFIPASLASSFLSMTQRFRSLGPILYDWLGAYVIIASVAIAFYFTLKGIFLIKSHGYLYYWSPIRTWKIDNDQPISIAIYSKCVAIIQLLIYGVLWGAVLACFVLGMFRDIRFGGVVLGYGIAGAVGFIIFGIVLLYLLRQGWYIRQFTK